MNPTPKGRIHRSSKQKPKFDESFHEAWERYKDLIRACPHHDFTELHQLDTFYNALNLADQDSLNAAAGHYNQGNLGYRPQAVANQMRPPGSGTLPGNTIANPKGELKVITTRSGLVTEGPTIPNPLKSVNPEEDECVEETYTDPDHAEYNIKVPPPPPLGLPDLIPTRMTLELANRAIYTPDEIARDVFVPVGKDCAKIIKKQSKLDKIEHKIERLHQNPDQRTFKAMADSAWIGAM
nr:reverse transcriptase domain-containing protein [Tanacetum cinerariifolium]